MLMKIKLLIVCIGLISLTSCTNTTSFLKPSNSTVSKPKIEIDKKKFEEEEKKILILQNLLNEYLTNPDQFISTKSNKDNFIAVFSNFTKINGEILYNQYNNKKSKDIQNLID